MFREKGIISQLANQITRSELFTILLKSLRRRTNFVAIAVTLYTVYTQAKFATAILLVVVLSHIKTTGGLFMSYFKSSTCKYFIIKGTVVCYM